MPATDGVSTNNDAVALLLLGELMHWLAARRNARIAGDRAAARDADRHVDATFDRLCEHAGVIWNVGSDGTRAAGAG